MSGRKQVLFTLKNISAKDAKYPNVYQLEVSDGVYVGAISDFTRALDRALIEAIGNAYVGAKVNTLGRLYTVTYQGEAEQFAKILVEVAEATFVAPPALEFAIVDNDKVNAGEQASVVFYRGAVSGNYLELPAGSHNLWVEHDPRAKSVAITSNNPLYPVTDELVAAVKSALAAASVPVK